MGTARTPVPTIGIASRARVCCVLSPVRAGTPRLRNSARPPQARGQGWRTGESLGLRGSSADRLSSPHVPRLSCNRLRARPRFFALHLHLQQPSILLYSAVAVCLMWPFSALCHYQKVAQKGCWRAAWIARHGRRVRRETCLRATCAAYVCERNRQQPD